MARTVKLGIRDETAALRVAKRLIKGRESLREEIAWLCDAMAQMHQGLPILDPGVLPRRLARIVDPDALFLFHEQLKPPPDERFDWAAVPLPASGRTEGLLRDGSVDTHIHLGGALPPVFYWLPLMGGEFLLDSLSRRPAVERGHAAEQVWQRRVGRAIWLRLFLAARLEEAHRARGKPPVFSWLGERWFESPELATDFEPPEKDPDLAREIALRTRPWHIDESWGDAEDGSRDWPFGDPLRPPSEGQLRHHYAAGERRFLYLMAQHLRKQDERQAPDLALLEVRTREYLCIRNAFHRLMIHDRGNQGLLRFVETFGRRGFLFGRRRPQRGRRQRRHRRLLAKLEQSRMTAALDSQLAEPFAPPPASDDIEKTAPELPPALRRIEMRVSLPRLREIPLTLRAWLDGLEDHLRPDKNGAVRSSQVGLIFHFLKGGTGREHCEEALDTAARMIYVLEEYPRLRPLIVGVDAAGFERSSNPRVFARAFHRLRRQGRSRRPSPGEAPIRLGWTFHVGEDVDDLLTGLRHLDETVSLLLPRDREGGRLGHALVLGDDPHQFYQRRGATEPSLGTHLLDLVWAWGRLLHVDDGDRARHWLAHQIRILSGAGDRRISKCFEAMHLDRPAASEDVLLLEDHLLEILCDHEDSPNLKRPHPVPTDGQWVQLISKLQELLRHRIARLRICVEANPTSNLLIGNYADYRALPYHKLVEDGIALSLNTDDPGLFLTTLPGELAAMYDAMAPGVMEAVEDQPTHREILTWLRERLFDADQSTFLGRHVPAGERALSMLKDALDNPGRRSSR